MVKVLGIKLYDSNIQNAYQHLLQTIKTSADKSNRLISLTGAHGLVTTHLDHEFKHLLNKFYINLPDGTPGVWIGKLKGKKEMAPCPGPNFFGHVIRQSAMEPEVRHFFCGGKPGVAEELKEVCLNMYKNPNIVGTFCPPFRELTDEEMAALGNEIIRSKADIVWIGLGTPKQEKFANRLAQFTATHFIITVGAAFDFHTGRVKYAPDWMLKFGLGWLFRLMMEPKRLFARYLQIIPLFIYLNLLELLNSFITRKNKTVQA